MFLETFFICYMQGIALLAMLVDGIYVLSSKNNRDNVYIYQFLKGFTGCGLFLLYGIMVFTCIDVTYGNTKRAYSYETNGGQLMAVIRNKVTKDTPALGMGATLIYSQLGWDSYYHLTDAIYQTEEGIAAYRTILLDGKVKILYLDQVSKYVDAGLFDKSIMFKMDEI